MISLILILLALAAIILGSHVLIGFTFIKLFGLHSINLNLAIYVILQALALSFVGSALLLHWWQNQPLRIFYYFSSLWMGMAMQLVLTAVIAWLLIYLFRFAGWRLNGQVLGSAMIIISLLIMILGIYRSDKIAVKSLNVKIPNLPAEWRGKTAVHISDVHVGAINQTAFMERQVKLINSLSPDAVFLTGDYFDGSWDDFANLAAPLRELNAPWGIYFVTGNHEVYDGVKIIEAALAKTPVKMIGNRVIDLNGVQIAGVNYPEEGLSKDIEPVLKMIDRSRPSILLCHEPLPAYVFGAKKSGVNLMLSGHTHAGQVFPANLITNLIYQGLDYGLHQDGDFYLYTTSGLGTWGPPIRTTAYPEIVKIIFE